MIFAVIVRVFTPHPALKVRDVALQKRHKGYFLVVPPFFMPRFAAIFFSIRPVLARFLVFFMSWYAFKGLWGRIVLAPIRFFMEDFAAPPRIIFLAFCAPAILLFSFADARFLRTPAFIGFFM